MKIAYFARDNGACSYYRVVLPNDTLHNKKLARAAKVEKGDSSEDIGKALDDADLVILPRVCDDHFTEFILRLQESGCKVAVEYDDYLFDISPLSPHYTDFGIEEVEVEMGGKKVKLWEDGKNIDLKTSQRRRDNVKKAIERADFTIVTNQNLAKAYSDYTDRFAILPNCIDCGLWQKLPLVRHEEIRLYWSGGASHYEDMLLMTEALGRIMRKYPQTKLIILGMKYGGALAGLPQDRIDYTFWVDINAYPYKTAIYDADISLIPLVDNKFNRCKSPIKWIEQSALGIPSVVSMVTPYMEEFDGDNMVLVADNTPEQWERAISMLIDDPLLRAKVGGAAQRYVRNNYDINDKCTLWLDAYRRYVGDK